MRQVGSGKLQDYSNNQSSCLIDENEALELAAYPRTQTATSHTNDKQQLGKLIKDAHLWMFLFILLQDNLSATITFH
jgi:hypothetical protein